MRWRKVILDIVSFEIIIIIITNLHNRTGDYNLASKAPLESQQLQVGSNRSCEHVGETQEKDRRRRHTWRWDFNLFLLFLTSRGAWPSGVWIMGSGVTQEASSVSKGHQSEDHFATLPQITFGTTRSSLHLNLNVSLSNVCIRVERKT